MFNVTYVMKSAHHDILGSVKIAVKVRIQGLLALNSPIGREILNVHGKEPG